ncbi:hypothetical protein AAHN97_15150 [Chitinophaga niabensis]|uniref:hypothetical protein n=1 Tax=Chitinophaga niabensis TaxID=536979 RepID=UPI0031BAFE83
MDNETLQKKFDRLLELSRRVRGYRKEYEKYHASVDWEKTRYWERKLDAFIKTELKVRDSKQKELF